MSLPVPTVGCSPNAFRLDAGSFFQLLVGNESAPLKAFSLSLQLVLDVVVQVAA